MCIHVLCKLIHVLRYVIAGGSKRVKSVETSSGRLSTPLQVEEVWVDWVHCQSTDLRRVPISAHSLCPASTQPTVSSV